MLFMVSNTAQPLHIQSLFSAVDNNLSTQLVFLFFYFSDSQLKDNPAFSMLNDSDDDVIYG